MRGKVRRRDGRRREEGRKHERKRDETRGDDKERGQMEGEERIYGQVSTCNINVASGPTNAPRQQCSSVMHRPLEGLGTGAESRSKRPRGMARSFIK